MGPSVINITEYKSLREPITFRNLETEEVFAVRFQSVKNYYNRTGELYTGNKRLERSKNDIQTVQDIDRKKPERFSNYKVLERNYISGERKDLKVECPLSHIYYTNTNDFISGRGGCNICNNHRWSISRISDFLSKENLSEEYLLLEDEKSVINLKKKITFKHNKCGNTFQMSLSNFVFCENRCPFCCHIVLESKPVKR